ncbi:MAG: ATP-binding protein [candidate division KSB1 bacterium]|nr:ATP-binding protein [candidate division KSB1 bacterium]MDZ7301819.1 ATP-binding protein [candidate division KSB1 bacterium]MDZ7314155.1 ATP-binding protein [candidate division KSB1 bacterium]
MQALADWNPWWETGIVPPDLKGIRRPYTDELIGLATERQVKIVTGVRRCGKSTLFYQIIDWLLQTKQVPPKHILLVNFEDLVLEQAGLEKIFAEYQAAFGAQEVAWVFLDEVGRQENWESWVRKWYDLKKNMQFFVTGSSAHLLKKEYATLLTGRNLAIEIFPLSFREFLSFSGVEISELTALSTTAANRMKFHFNQYLATGGFPEIFSKREDIKRRLLNQYFEDILYKDIVARFGANYQKLKELAIYLLTNNSNLLSQRRLRGGLEMGLGTISEYLGFLEDAWLIFQSPKFDYSYQKQIANPKKIYAIDLGLKDAVSFRFSEDYGRNLENLIAIELKRRGQELFYWKNGRGMETDFLIRIGTTVQSAIQVAAKLTDPKIKKREVSSLLSAIEHFTLKEGLILTGDESGIEKIDDKIIRYQPVWQWLLQPSPPSAPSA